MSIKDIIKKSFLESVSASNISAKEILFIMVLVSLLSLYIFFIYRLFTRKTFYNKSFNIALVALALITAAIIVTIQSSIVVSLGMVGALSIVRFRTAIKDPMDLVFLFWSISLGIICGARLYIIAVVLCLFVSIILFALNRIPVVNAPMILVVNATDPDVEDNVIESVKKYASSFRIKSRSLTSNQLDIVVELRTKEDKSLVKSISELNGIVNVSLLSHDGEVTF